MVQGEWRLTDGTKFVGSFQGQKPLGDGTWHTAKGRAWVRPGGHLCGGSGDL